MHQPSALATLYTEWYWQIVTGEENPLEGRRLEEFEDKLSR